MRPAIRVSATLAALAFLTILTVPARAQQEARGQVSLAGPWTLDPYVSDHPEQLARALRFTTPEPRADTGSPAAARDQVGRGGGARADRGGAGRSGGVPWEPINERDRKLLVALTDAVRFPPPSLTISQAESTVTIAADGGTPVTMRTNGKPERLTIAAGAVDRTALWDGPELIVSFDVGQAGFLRYTYLRAPTTGQLVIRVDFDRHRGESSVFDVRLVYNPATPATRTGAEVSRPAR